MSIQLFNQMVANSIQFLNKLIILLIDTSFPYSAATDFSVLFSSVIIQLLSVGTPGSPIKSFLI